MRTIEQIKQELQESFMQSEALATAYGFETGTAFSSVFSKVSIENLLLYIVAVGIYVLEALFAEHKKEVDAAIEATLPHRPKWYRDKVLQFMVGKTLIEDTDQYDTTGMTEEAIEAARVVKYAAATESPDASILTIKVAGERDGERATLDETTESQLLAYLSEVKDAGVRIALVNQEADQFRCTIDIYYDVLLPSSEVEASCRKAIARYIQNLPFNGEYTNMALIDALQGVEGVRIAEMKSAAVTVAGAQAEMAIDTRYRPAAGYLKAAEANVTLNMTPYDEQV